MKSKIASLVIFGLFACSFMPFVSQAQEGHPMSGSWVGDWGFSDNERNRVVIIMEWTGSELVGTVNPGPAAMPITTAMVNPDDWSLHLEARGADAQGEQVTFVAEGTLDDLGTYNRNIAGTWRVGNRQGNFSITRQ